MKSKPNRFVAFRRIHLAALSLCLAPGVFAAALTWDTDTDTSGAQDGSGNWTTGSGNWRNTTTSTDNATWTAGDTATFGMGILATDTVSKTITVSGSITTGVGSTSQGGIHFASSGYTLSASSTIKTITMGSASGTANLSVASGKSATIGTNVRITGYDLAAGSSAMNIFGGGTLNIVGTGAELRTGSNNMSIYGGTATTAGTTINVGVGGKLNAANSQIIIGTNSGNATVVVDGGSLIADTVASGAQNFILANNNTAGGTVYGTLTINSGLVSNPKASGGLRFGSSTNNSGATAFSNASLNLNGGILEIGYLFSGTATGVTRNSAVNLNGGTLKVLSGSTNAGIFMTGLSNAYVKEGGAIIDTNGVATTIGQVLQHGGVVATDGGLVKKGSGTLTLTGNNTYSGTTEIQLGTLSFGRVGGTLLDTAAVNVNGGILDVANADTVGAVTLTSGTISGAAALTGTSYTLKSGSVSSELAGSGIVLTKNTSGTVTLGGTQSYTGATNIDAGTLNVTGSLASAINVNAGGTLGGEGSTSSSLTFGTGSSGFNYDPATGTAFAAGSILVDGSAFVLLTPTGATTTGTPYLVLTNNAGFAGGVIPTNFAPSARGSLSLSNSNKDLNFTPTAAASLKWTGANGSNPTYWDAVNTVNWDNGGSADRFYTNDSVTFDDTASSFVVAVQGVSVSPGAVAFDNSTNAYTLSGGALIGTTLAKSGSNTLTISNSNTFSGGTTISAGSIQLGDGTNATGSLTGAIINNGTLETNHGANNFTLSNDISGSGAYTKSGVGTVILTGSNSYNGTTTINAGTLKVGDNGTAGSLGAGAVVNNGVLIFDRTDAVIANNDVSGTGSITKQRASSLTLGGTLSHGGGISLTTGTLTLGGNNSYNGQTTISAGSGVIVTANNALGATGAGNETVLSGAGGVNSGAIGLSGGINYGSGEKIIGAGLGNTAANGAFVEVQRGIVQSISGDNTFAGDIEISSTGITRFGTQNGADLTLSGSITRGTGVTGVTVLFRPNLSGDWVTVSGSGSNWDNETLIFTAATSGAGGVRLGASDALSTVATLRAGGNTTGTGTTLDLNGFNQAMGGLFNSNGTLHITNNAASTNSVLTLNTAADWSSDSTNNKTTIEDGLGQVSLVKEGTFKQTLAGTHTYTGDTTIMAGTLALTSTGTIASSANIIVGDSGSSGTVLDVTAKSAFTIGSTQTLSGIGTVNIGTGKTVTIEGTHAPGNSAGIQSITGNLSYASGSIFEWDLASGTLGTRGTDYDGVDVSETLGGSGAIFKVVLGTGSFEDAFWNETREWTGIFTASNGFDMSSIFSSIQWWEGTTDVTGDMVSPPGHFTFTDSGTTLTWTAVPEPTSALAGLLITAGLLRRRRANAR